MELNKTDSTLDKVLARKWRPKNFSQVVGQETTVKALKHALKTNRLHHAYLSEIEVWEKQQSRV